MKAQCSGFAPFSDTLFLVSLFLSHCFPLSSFQFIGADGKPVVRPYTPIHQHEKGTLTLLVKHYPTGVMSQRERTRFFHLFCKCVIHKAKRRGATKLISLHCAATVSM